MVGRRAASFYLGDLIPGQAPQTQPVPGGVQICRRARPHAGQLAIRQLVHAAQYLEQLFLRGKQFRAVQVNQVIATGYRDARVVRV